MGIEVNGFICEAKRRDTPFSVKLFLRRTTGEIVDLGYIEATNAVSISQLLNKQVTKSEYFDNRLVLWLNNQIWLNLVADEKALDPHIERIYQTPLQLLVGDVISEVICPVDSKRIGLKLESGNFFSGCPVTPAPADSWKFLEKCQIISLDESAEDRIVFKLGGGKKLIFSILFPPPDLCTSAATFEYSGPGSFIVELGSEHDAM